MTVPPTVRSAWGKFLGFWFNPADPSTMAFIRIVTGCLTLYVHLAYCFDLNAFFGRDAWYDLNTANRGRWEEPTRFPGTEWEHTEVTRSAAFPDTEAARRAVFQWVRDLPTDKDVLARRLRLIDEGGILNGQNLPRYPYVHPYLPYSFSWFALDYSKKLSPNAEVRATALKTVTGELPPDKNDPVQFEWLSVGYLRSPDGGWGGGVFRLPEVDIQRLAKDLRDFAAAQPANDPKAVALTELADAVAARNLAGYAGTGLPDHERAWAAMKGVTADLDRLASDRKKTDTQTGELLTADMRLFSTRLKNYGEIQGDDRLFRGVRYIARELKEFARRIEREYPQEAATMTGTADLLEGLPAQPKVNALLMLVVKVFALDLDAFYSTLPVDLRERAVVLKYVENLGTILRDNLLEFLRDTTSERVPAFERERRIKYVERWGYEERYLQRAGVPIFSFWFHVTEPGEMIAVHVGVLIVLLMFTLGLFTRITSVLTWLATVSYLHRDPQILFGQDTMMNILLIYLMVANSGAALSLDRVIARYRATRASFARCGGIDATCAAFLAAPPPSVSSGFAQRLLQVHFCFIYMAAGLSKLKGASWWSADAMWMTLVNPEFTMIHFDWYENLIRGVFSSRPLYSVIATVGVVFTIFMEVGLPFLVWTRLRPYMVIGGFLLHFGVGVFMGLLVFSLYMMTMLLSYLPGSAFRDGLFGNGVETPKPGQKPKPPPEKKTVPLNPADPKSAHAAAWAVAWDTSDRVVLVKS